MLHDNQDHDIPFADHDDWTECGIDDPDYNEPELWPEWTDEIRFSPTQADVEFLNCTPILPATAPDPTAPFIPSAADWADYAEWCKHVDELNELRRINDSEYDARQRYGV